MNIPTCHPACKNAIQVLLTMTINLRIWHRHSPFVISTNERSTRLETVGNIIMKIEEIAEKSSSASSLSNNDDLERLRSGVSQTEQLSNKQMA